MFVLFWYTEEKEKGVTEFENMLTPVIQHSNRGIVWSRTNIHWTQGFSVIQRCAYAVQGRLRVCWEVAPWRVESRDQASTDLVIRMPTASKGETHLKMKNMTC